MAYDISTGWPYRNTMSEALQTTTRRPGRNRHLTSTEGSHGESASINSQDDLANYTLENKTNSPLCDQIRKILSLRTTEDKAWSISGSSSLINVFRYPLARMVFIHHINDRLKMLAVSSGGRPRHS